MKANPDIRDGRFILYSPKGEVFLAPFGCDLSGYIRKGFSFEPAQIKAPKPEPEPEVSDEPKRGKKRDVHGG